MREFGLLHIRLPPAIGGNGAAIGLCGVVDNFKYRVKVSVRAEANHEGWQGIARGKVPRVPGYRPAAIKV